MAEPLPNPLSAAMAHELNGNVLAPLFSAAPGAAPGRLRPTDDAVVYSISCGVCTPLGVWCPGVRDGLDGIGECVADWGTAVSIGIGSGGSSGKGGEVTCISPDPDCERDRSRARNWLDCFRRVAGEEWLEPMQTEA